MAIEVSELRKSYGEVVAVRGVNFEVSAGEVFCLLGPNGAGKTTTVEMLDRPGSGLRTTRPGAPPERCVPSAAEGRHGGRDALGRARVTRRPAELALDARVVALRGADDGLDRIRAGYQGRHPGRDSMR